MYIVMKSNFQILEKTIKFNISGKKITIPILRKELKIAPFIILKLKEKILCSIILLFLIVKFNLHVIAIYWKSTRQISVNTS